MFGHPNKNLNKARIDGAEFSVNANIDSWMTKLSLTLLDPINADTNKVLDRRSKKTIKLSTDRKFNAFTIGGSILSQGERMDDGVRIDGYTIVSLRIKKQIEKNTSISLKANNVTDKEYQTIDGYRMPEATTYVTLEHQF